MDTSGVHNLRAGPSCNESITPHHAKIKDSVNIGRACPSTYKFAMGASIVLGQNRQIAINGHIWILVPPKCP